MFGQGWKSFSKFKTLKKMAHSKPDKFLKPVVGFRNVALIKTKTSNLASMGVISFYAGVRHKRYSGQRDKWFLETNISAPDKNYEL